MKIPFVSFLPMEKEMGDKLREAFDRVLTNSWYIQGAEDEAGGMAEVSAAKSAPVTVGFGGYTGGNTMLHAKRTLRNSNATGLLDSSSGNRL